MRHKTKYCRCCKKNTVHEKDDYYSGIGNILRLVSFDDVWECVEC